MFLNLGGDRNFETSTIKLSIFKYLTRSHMLNAFWWGGGNANSKGIHWLA
jgi:hypothetical protein